VAIEFIRMKLSSSSSKPILLSGSAVLQPDGVIDLFGDAIAHADAIVAAIEGFDSSLPMTELRLSEAEAPSARRAAPSLQVDKIRIGANATLTPMALRPGRPAAIVPEAGEATRSAVWRELSAFRTMRRAACGRTLHG
jgi:hypothetical protein